MNPSQQNANIDELLVSHSQRLITMQVTLKEAFKARQLTTSSYKKRMKLTNQLLDRIESLRKWSLESETSDDEQESLSLPNLEGCTPEEQEICERFMAERLQMIGHLTADLRKVAAWAEQTSMGRHSWLTMPFRFSFLRKVISRLEIKINQLQFHEEELEKYSEKVSDLFTEGSARKGHVRANITALMDLFYRIDQRSRRLSKLRRDLLSRESEIAKMREWLTREENSLAQPMEYEEPPQPMATLAMSEQIGLSTGHSIEGTRRRLTLAKRYLEEHDIDSDLDDEDNHVTVEVPNAADLRQVAYGQGRKGVR